MRMQARFDIAQIFAVNQLGKGQTQKRLQTREAVELVLPVIEGDTTTKRRQRQELGQLGENELSGVHVSDPRQMTSQAHNCRRISVNSSEGRTANASEDHMPFAPLAALIADSLRESSFP